MKTDKEITIITGGGRCGTKFFGRHLQEMMSDCLSTHEPDILYWRDPELLQKIRRFGIYQTVIGKLLRRRGLRNLSVRSYEATMPENEIIRRLEKERLGFFSQADGRSIIEANAAWWGVVQHAHHLGDDVRVASIIRDPVDWITSWSSHGGLHDKRDIVGRLRLGRLERPEWGTSAWERLANTWATLYGHLDQVSESSATHRMFRFEDLFGDDTSAYEDFLQFVARDDRDRIDWKHALELRGKPANASRRDHRNAEMNLDVIRSICGPLADKYGYRITTSDE